VPTSVCRATGLQRNHSNLLYRAHRYCCRTFDSFVFSLQLSWLTLIVEYLQTFFTRSLIPILRLELLSSPTPSPTKRCVQDFSSGFFKLISSPTCIETFPNRLLVRDRKQSLWMSQATLPPQASEAQPQGSPFYWRMDLFSSRLGHI